MLVLKESLLHKKEKKQINSSPENMLVQLSQNSLYFSLYTNNL